MNLERVPRARTGPACIYKFNHIGCNTMGVSSVFRIVESAYEETTNVYKKAASSILVVNRDDNLFIIVTPCYMVCDRSSHQESAWDRNFICCKIESQTMLHQPHCL